MTRRGTLKRKHRVGRRPIAKPQPAKYALAAVQREGAWHIINRNTNETLREGISYARACDVVATQSL